MNLTKIADEHKILEITVGSHLYGTNTPTSDLDYSGVFLPTKEFVYGFQKVEEVNLSITDKDKKGKNTQNAVDRKLYEFRKFVKLAMENNPNIIEQLFVNEPNIVYINEQGKALLAKRYEFPHKGLIQKFRGYAFSQKHKMVIRSDKFHELNNAFNYLKEYAEPKELLIELKDKCLPFMKFTKDFCAIGDLNLQKGIFVKKAVAMIEERLSKVGNRKNLITKYGFDTKFASNLIRLLLEGKELVSTGEILFPLSYKDIILEIKEGKWTIKEVLDYAEQLEAEMDIVAEKSELPNKPKYDEIEQFTIHLLENYLRMGGRA
ncbi:nucleotidyltransferase domain-containing protein [Candidatus Parabeggiatoa sp. HSG14]|uniref:DNA polymerase beta superfamily protein n=1 Tax=Candidatus Parabeggiatoa sp. HSG14 TaxID=3055593 RepID=UPI0025A815F6|nr:nucleotidyltransferase domain-containing protein [Thiotrichales bacterium HSG14]